MDFLKKLRSSQSQTNQNQTKPVGIYIGMKYLFVSTLVERGRSEMIVTDNGNWDTPLYVAFTENEMLTGENAMMQMDTNPTNTVYDIMELIGNRFSDPCIQRGIKQWPFRVVAGSDDKPIVVVKYKNVEKQFSAEELLSVFLATMKSVVEDSLQCTLKNVVITIPGYLDDTQRCAVTKACSIANIDVLQIIDVPTAASIYLNNYYGPHPDWRSFLILHSESRASDISIVSMNGKIIKLEAIVGDSHLGGGNFTDSMVEHCIREFRRQHEKDIGKNASALRRLKRACESAEIALLEKGTTNVAVEYQYDGIDFTCPISQDLLEELNSDIITKYSDLIDKCLRDAQKEKSDIYKLQYVNVSAHLPNKMYELMGDFSEHTDTYYEEVVAGGAALFASYMEIPEYATDRPIMPTLLENKILINNEKDRRLRESINKLEETEHLLSEEKERRELLETQLEKNLMESQLKKDNDELQKENRKLQQEITQYEQSYQKIFAMQYEFYDCEDSDDDQ